MESKDRNVNEETKKPFFYSKGILYYSRRTERSVFFILTIIMLALGLLVKLGIL